MQFWKEMQFERNMFKISLGKMQFFLKISFLCNFSENAIFMKKKCIFYGVLGKNVILKKNVIFKKWVKFDKILGKKKGHGFLFETWL